MAGKIKRNKYYWTIEMLDLMKRELEEDIWYHPKHWLNKIHRKRIRHLKIAIKVLEGK